MAQKNNHVKKLSFLLFALTISASSFAQSSAGLVAHWNMNGNANDTSGNGHNGNMVNVTPAVGMDGVAGHALYFNGTTSMITVPYSPAFSMPTAYSICAVVKAEGFYGGNYADNMILTRGKTGPASGSYYLTFSSYPYTLNCCTTDTTKESFEVVSETRPVSTSGYYYTPNIIRNTWYKVVGTFNDTTFKVYVDGVLKSSVGVSSPGTPLGTSTDSISIGYNIFEATSGFPYQFKGMMDDIRLYNRVLNDSEIVHYTDTCGHITFQPVSDTSSVGSTVTYSVSSGIVGATWQWQENSGSGFANLTNSGPYSGVYTPTLTITGVTASMQNRHYRCLIANNWGCSDSSSGAALLLPTIGIEHLSLNEAISVYPNPASGMFIVELPFDNGIGTIQLMNPAGQLLAQKKIEKSKTDIDISTYPAGVYILKVEYNGAVAYRKLLKH